MNGIVVLTLIAVPLGTASSAECQIDSIAQSWSVLSGGGDAGLCNQAIPLERGAGSLHLQKILSKQFAL